MKYGDYYVTARPEYNIERDNPETGKTDICPGYYCEVFRERKHQEQVDAFWLAVGYEIEDMSQAALDDGLHAFLGGSVDYMQSISDALEAAQEALEVVDAAEKAGAKIHPSIINRLVTTQITLSDVLKDAQKAQDLAQAVKVQPGRMNMATEGLEVAGHVGTWHVIDHVEVAGHNFWLMEHDTYRNSAAHIIVDDQGELVLSSIYGGFDDHVASLLYQEVMPVDRLPDESITIRDMKNYGYAWGGMLPMHEAAALETMKSCTVYRLYQDDTEGMVVDADEIRRHAAEGGIFGVEKIEWNAMLERQARRESIELPVVNETCVKFADLFQEPFAKALDAHFARQGWELQARTVDDGSPGYMVYFGEGVQVDNRFEHGFDYLVDKDELEGFARHFYETHLSGRGKDLGLLGYECGVLLKRDHEEFERYACNNPALPYGFYDEDQGLRAGDDLDALRQEMRSYVEHGVDMTYAVISDQGLANDPELDDILKNMDANAFMGYSFFKDPDAILYSVCKVDGEIREGFLEALIQASREQGREVASSKASLEHLIQSASTRAAEKSSPDNSPSKARDNSPEL